MSADVEGTGEPVFKKIIVGHDGSAQAEDALAFAKALIPAQLLVAQIFPHEAFLDSPVPEPDEPQHALVEQRTAEVREELRPVAEQAGGAPVVVAGTSPAHGLHRLAVQLEADLIIVGSSHRGRAGQVLAGTAGERVLHGAPCAVAVARRGFAREPELSLGQIGVGYNGSSESRLALQEATRIGLGVGAALKLFAVAPNTPFAERDRLKDELEATVAALPDELQVEGVLLSGHPNEVLGEQEVDLLVVGSRGYGPLRTLLLGGVSGPLVRSASSTVLVLPRGLDSPRHSP